VTLRCGILIGFLLASLCLPAPPAAALQLVLATDDTPGPPYIIGGGTSFKLEKPGIEIELYNRVAARLGLQFIYKRFSWARCLELVKSGHVDGIFPASFKKARLALGVYPMKNGQPDAGRKTRDNTYSLYKLKTTPLTWDGRKITQLGDGAIGVPVGWAIAEDLKAMGVAVSDIHLPSSSMDMLIGKRFAGLALLETVADAYLIAKPEAYKTIVRLSPPLKSNAYYLLLSHQFVSRHPDLAEKIWDAVAAIQKTDAYRQAAAEY